MGSICPRNLTPKVFLSAFAIIGIVVTPSSKTSMALSKGNIFIDGTLSIPVGSHTNSWVESKKHDEDWRAQSGDLPGTENPHILLLLRLDVNKNMYLAMDVIIGNDNDINNKGYVR